MTTREINRSELAIWAEGTPYTTDDLVRLYEGYCREQEEVGREPLNENRWAMREVGEPRGAASNSLSVEEIRQRMGDLATTEQAARMLDLLNYSSYADTPTADIPEREWLRMLDIACGE